VIYVKHLSKLSSCIVTDESGSLPAAAALALTLHHLTGGKTSQSRIKQESRYYFALAHAASCCLVDLVSLCCDTTQLTDKLIIKVCHSLCYDKDAVMVGLPM